MTTRGSSSIPHMSPDEFRRAGHELVDFLADYLSSVSSRPVLCPLQPGETIAKLPLHAPVQGETWADIRADVDRIVLPGLTHWQSPDFFAFFPANASEPAILGDLLCSGLGVQGMLWATSPACTEIETRVLDWLGEMSGLPSCFRSTSSTGGGVIHSTASEATLVALCAARFRAQSRAEPNASSPHLTLYASTQAHSSIVKAAMIAGLARSPEDRTHLRLIDTDDSHAMDPASLKAAIDADLALGYTPAFVCATVGTTSSTAIDPIVPIGEICAKHNVWLHVDAAFSGAACICPELRAAHFGPLDADGIATALNHADSLVFNPHKWLLTNFDCSTVWTRDTASWTGAMNISPEYLRNSTSGQVIDYRNWQVPLGRRFRALKLWFVLRHYGLSGLQAYIREHVRIAGVFESLVASDKRFEIVTPRTSSLVCFRLAPKPGEASSDTDARNAALLNALNNSGKVYLTHTVLPALPRAGVPARTVLRMAIGSTRTQEHHVRSAWALIQCLASELP